MRGVMSFVCVTYRHIINVFIYNMVNVHVFMLIDVIFAN